MSNTEQTRLSVVPTIAALLHLMSPSTDGLAPALRDVFDRESLPIAQLRVDAQQSIYGAGDDDDALYLIESGQVKLFIASAEGKECVLALCTAGDLFGESCFLNERRYESASAIMPCVLRRVTRREFVGEVARTAGYESLLRHLAARLHEVQIAVFEFVTMDAERRLAKVLLTLAEKLGTADGPYVRAEMRISQEELSQIVGTTRPRISAFMQRFRRRGLIVTAGRSVAVHRQRAREFFERETTASNFELRE